MVRKSPTCRALSVIIPAYNEEVRLPKALCEIYRFLIDRRYDAEILVVDDGSRDGTRERLGELRTSFPMLKVLGYSQNRGKGFAVRSGVLAATRDALLFSDADLSTPIEEIDLLWPWYDRGYDIAIGSRHMSQSRILVQQPLHRRIIGHTFSMLVGLFGVRGFRDTQCGFKLFRKDVARKIFSDLKTYGFAFDVEVLTMARKAGVKVAEVPVRWANAPDSRVHPFRDSFRMLLDLIKIRGAI